MKKLLLVLALLMGFAASAQAQPEAVPQTIDQLQLSFAPLVKKTSPAVVNIYAKRLVRQQLVNPLFADPFFSQFFGGRGLAGPVQERVENALGSGVIVDPKGTIATNTHVIKGATEISVVMQDGREFIAQNVLTDEKTDLAILKIDPKGEVLPHLEIADSDALEVGDIVLAIGNPFGVGQTVTSGIVSGLARTGVGATDYSFFIQTDAAINPGNSGGALVDINGRLVGINSMIFSRDGGSLGIGFAIPANMVKTVLAASQQGGKLVRPWSGFNGQSVTPDMVESLGLKRAYGVLVNGVKSGSPAEKAGLKIGDVVLMIDGREVQDPEALKFRFAMLPMGSAAHLKVLRGSAPLDLVMVMQAPPETPAREETVLKGENPLAGVTVVNISPAVSEEIGGLERDEGVAILKPGNGYGARLGLAPRDIVLSVNGVEVPSVANLKKLLSRNERRWQVGILRRGQLLNLMITI